MLIDIDKQAGTVLGQAQLKLELELGLCYTAFKICCIKLLKLTENGLVELVAGISICRFD